MPFAEVIVIGAGPVGLTLALELGLCGIRVLLVEKRDQLLRLPKMERSNPRTMEIYRRLGMVDKIRAAAYPPDAPMDITIVRDLTKPPLVHQVYPTVAQSRARISSCTDGSLPREPYQLVSQYTLEALLLEEVKRLPSVELRMATELKSLTHDQDSVQARLWSADRGVESVAQCSYLIGCDGANSAVRDFAGIAMQGARDLGTVTNIFFRSDDFLSKCRVPHSRHYLFAGVGANGGAAGAIVVQDDRKHFGCHMPIVPGPGIDLQQELRKLTGLDIRPEILFVGRWTQNMLVAEQHAVGRVLLAGDANHVFIPAGGLGMNTGIGDAHNLAWKIAATLRGWGGPALLASYQAERGTVARRNIKAVQFAVDGVIAWRKLTPPPEVLDSSEQERGRAAFAAVVEPLNRRVYEMHGTELGYRYDSSVICREAGEPPPDESYIYRPTTWPGAHLPHGWLQPGVALYDQLASGFNLVLVGITRSAAKPITDVFKALRAPLSILEVDPSAFSTILGRKMLLVRPDLQVAWRGDLPPADAYAVARKALGFDQ